MPATRVTPVATTLESDTPLGIEVIATLRRLADIFEHDEIIRTSTVALEGVATVSVTITR